MNLQEAKFILRASRPDGQDANDPQVREALELAKQDPVLAQWLARERLSDQAIAAALSKVAPPPDLRAQILAGARASRVIEFPWWKRMPVLAAAAAVALMLSVSFLTWKATRPTPHTWSEFAAFDLYDHHVDHSAHQRGIGDVEAMLASTSTRLTSLPSISTDTLKSHGCRAITFAGREVFEICFKRDGTWYHLYVGRRNETDPAAGAAPVIAALRGGHVATWADNAYAFALVTSAEANALSRVL